MEAVEQDETKFNKIHLGGSIEGDVGMFKVNRAGMGWQAKDRKVVIRGSDVKKLKFVHVAKYHRLWVKQRGGAVAQFDGFRAPDLEALQRHAKLWDAALEIGKEELSTAGWHWGELAMGKGGITFMVGDKKAFELPLSAVAQATQIKDDVQLIFPPNADSTGVTPSLVELRFTFPENGALKGEKREGQERPDPITNAKFFAEAVLAESNNMGSGGEQMLVRIPKVKVVQPRGRFELDMYPRYAKLEGNNPYRIPYEHVTRMHHLPSPKGDQNVMFILTMEPPIRRGAVVIQHIIMELPSDEHLSLTLALTEEQINQYQGQLNVEMKGKPSSLIARLFKVLTGKKVTIPGGSFKSSQGHSQVPCSVGASTGNLYLLERSMFFIEKPAMNILYEHIEQVEFQRHSQVASSNRNFDLEVKLKAGRTVALGGGRSKNTVSFSHIAHEERTAFVNLFRQKDIALKGLVDDNEELAHVLGDDDDDDDDGGDRPPTQRKRAAPSSAGAGAGAGNDEDSEHDSDFGSQKSSESDDLEYASKASSDSDSEGPEEGGASKPKKSKPAQPEESE